MCARISLCMSGTIVSIACRRVGKRLACHLGFMRLGSYARSRTSVKKVDKLQALWRSLFANPSNWWDNREGKPNARFPDFTHKNNGEVLWLNNSQNPAWVASEVASLTPGVAVFALARTLSRYNKTGQYEKTMNHFRQMQKEGRMLNRYDFVQVVNACAALEIIEEGRVVHKLIIEAGCQSDLYVGNSLVDMYSKFGSIEDAWKIFIRMPVRDVVSWTTMIMGLGKHGLELEALQLYKRMQKHGMEPDRTSFVILLNACASIAALEEGKHLHEQIFRRGCESDLYICSSLVDMYAKCGSIEDAQKVFDGIPSPDVVSYNAMISGLGKCGQGVEALELRKRMQRDRVKPNSSTFVALLNACASVAALEEGRRLHEQINLSRYESDVCVGSCLIDMYAKCGSIEDAQSVFYKMPSRNVVSWTTMIMGFAMHGLAKEAVACFEQMSVLGLEVNEITFICLLSACSHGGLVKEGMQYFRCMQSVYGVCPTQEHYTCAVDILGRAGHLDDAEALVKGMVVEPSATVWMSLLGACRVHGNVEMGERAAQQILKSDPKNPSGYVLLSNIYAAAGHFDRQNIVQSQRRGKKSWKLPGCAWIEVANKVHSFVAHEWTHPQIKEILAELDKLSEQMKDVWYVPDTRFVIQNLPEEKQVERLCGHSEKLALAFGLISTPEGSPLKIAKNMRVCGDCHLFTKFISKITGRQISIRDANRFHHFKDGHCSCGDYW